MLLILFHFIRNGRSSRKEEFLSNLWKKNPLKHRLTDWPNSEIQHSCITMRFLRRYTKERFTKMALFSIGVRVAASTWTAINKNCAWRLRRSTHPTDNELLMWSTRSGLFDGCAQYHSWGGKRNRFSRRYTSRYSYRYKFSQGVNSLWFSKTRFWNFQKNCRNGIMQCKRRKRKPLEKMNKIRWE